MIFGQDAKYDYFPFECASLPLWRLLATFTVLSSPLLCRRCSDTRNGYIIHLYSWGGREERERAPHLTASHENNEPLPPILAAALLFWQIGRCRCARLTAEADKAKGELNVTQFLHAQRG